MIDSTVGHAPSHHVEVFAGRDDNDEYRLSWHSMGREEAPFYHAIKRPANVKPTFDERCSAERDILWLVLIG